MTIKNFVRMASIVGIIIILLFVAGTVALQHSSAQTRRTQELQLRSLALSRETADNSYGLTANVRSYVASGNKLFRDNYFEILDVRSGAKPRPATAAVAPGRQVELGTLYDEAGFTADEKKSLAEANRLSGDLAKLETEAMESVEGAPVSERSRASLEASRLLHSEAYLNAAKAIQVPVGEFERLLAERLDRADKAAESLASWTQWGLYIVVALTAVLILCAILWMRRRSASFRRHTLRSYRVIKNVKRVLGSGGNEAASPSGPKDARV
jgi:hypothetical protein